MIIGCLTACGSNKTEQTNNSTQTTESVEVTDTTDVTTEDTDVVEIMTYEFETFDGVTIVINEDNIVSQEACDEPLEWAELPADAEQLAPGRDCIIFEDSTNYYVEDATNNLVTVATKEASETQTYEFDTFDGEKVVIDDTNIVSMEACDEPLEWAELPADAEQLAPGRDCILFADSTYYYIEDATNNLVIVANK